MDGNGGRWQQRGIGVGKWGQCGGVGRWCLAAVEDCGSIGRRRQKKNMPWWNRRQCYQSKGLTISTSASALAKMAREDASDARDIRWQQWQGDRHFTVVVVVVAVQI
jgi:hypothetical protein